MRYSLALILLLSLTACGTTTHSMSDGLAKGPTKPASEMYAKAMTDMQNKDYQKAATALKALLSRYPYGIYSQQAQMELAYAYYKLPDSESALSAADRFIKDYPTSPNLDYVLYLKGLTHFYPTHSFFDSLYMMDRADTDPENLEAAFAAFKDLVSRFPNSIYSANARLRMQYLANTLARHQLKIAHYYMRRGAYVAAVNRAKAVLMHYRDTPETIDALRVLVASYDYLGLPKLRDDAQRILDLNTGSAAASAPAATTTGATKQAMEKLAAAETVSPPQLISPAAPVKQ